MVEHYPYQRHLSESMERVGMLSTQIRLGLTQLHRDKDPVSIKHLKWCFPARELASQKSQVWPSANCDGTLVRPRPCPCHSRSSLVLFPPLSLTQAIYTSLTISISKLSSETVSQVVHTVLTGTQGPSPQLFCNLGTQ